MRNRVLLGLVMILAGGVASAGLTHHTVTFKLVNTGTGVSDGRLRFHIDRLAVPGDEYFFDNVTLSCVTPSKSQSHDKAAEILVNGDLSAGQAPWKFFTNAPAPKPSIAVVGGEAVISFGSDGSNTQFYQKDLVLPKAGSECTLEFDACAGFGPFGNNTGLELIKHTAPYTKYGLDLSGTPPNAELSLFSCAAGPSCGDGDVDSGQGEDCDEFGANTATCDSDCTFPLCGDGLTNPNTLPEGEECDDGGFDKGGPVGGDGCDANCQLEPFCGNGMLDAGENCDNGGGTVANQTTTESATCDIDCSSVMCGDFTVNTTAGEECDGIDPSPEVGCDMGCNLDAGVFEAAVCTVFLQLGAMPVPNFCLP